MTKQSTKEGMKAPLEILRKALPLVFVWYESMLEIKKQNVLFLAAFVVIYMSTNEVDHRMKKQDYSSLQYLQSVLFKMVGVIVQLELWNDKGS